MKEFKTYDYNNSEVENIVKQIIIDGLNSVDKIQSLKTVLSIIDLTTLEGSDTDQKVVDLCKKARSFSNLGKDMPNVAAVCVYPTLVKVAKKELIDTDIKIASVAGAFPSGQSPIKIKLDEIKYAIDEGADEIDMVISRGKFLEQNYSEVYGEIAAIKNVCKNVHLKVILETGELQTFSNIRKASDIAIEAGADFIKTSTGKISPAATETAHYVMLTSIKDHYLKTGKKIGIKPAGGISEPLMAINYLILTEKVLGKEWLNKDLFRIGASRMADKLVSELIN